ncbi:5-formyltetrahydrofolate cyclo-ligase [Paraglaciecola aestuariivivens]
MHNKTRQIIRKTFRDKRKALSPEQQKLAAKQVVANCLSHTSLSQAQTVAVYLTNDGELNPQGIIDYCWQQHKKVALPVLHPFSTGHLVFVEYHPTSPMKPNCFGIPEPILQCQSIVPLAQIDLLFTPLVAFDLMGNRLGMGGGFYDRSLAPLARDKSMTQIVGLAHDCQQANNLPIENWDIPLHGIATPTQYFQISS